MPKRPRIVITMGDPAGIGPEVSLRAVFCAELLAGCRPILLGDRSVLESVADRCHLELPGQILTRSEFESVELDGLSDPLLIDFQNVDLDEFRPGEISSHTGRASYDYIEQAISWAKASQVDGVTTGPINKRALQLAGIDFPGHTEIFTQQTGSRSTCMMQYSPEITCSFVTTHIGYREVPQQLSSQRIIDVIGLSAEALSRILKRPTSELRFVVCGLNPHAGEAGLFGDREEERIIQPAIEQCRQAGLQVSDPLPPDTCFLPERRAETDCFICMYHDQGHIPLKALAFDQAVNTTLGLPIVRTSVDHGTALDIAWQGIANPSSMLRAAQLAASLALQPTC
ncbi:MAG: 4-hydroxythreonine-4-phosphate dehydrogenase PdxA [Mariniblastus sp.]|nr:4-hydroxythreonine-4-phosphate dehydrogenase PdxA [Mariniblastus sp.]